jgi:hypothetical protein
MMFEQGVSLSALGTPAQGTSWRLSPEFVVGFLPAFRHGGTGEVRLCQLADGRIARFHRLDVLPEEWIAERDEEGRPSALIGAVEPGYQRGPEFWSLAEMTRPALDG